MNQNNTLDVLVVGGGAAGLAAAVTLARSRRSVTVVDGGRPRNAPAEGVHALLGREGISPAELLAAGRRELAGYGGVVVEGEISSVRRLPDDGFEATLSGETVISARRLVIATGLVDELPEIPGLAERWGRDVIHCPYCHGWEVRDQAVVVLGTAPASVHQALLFSQLSDNVRFLAHAGPLDPEDARKLRAKGIEIVNSRARRLEAEGFLLADDSLLPAEAVVVAPRMIARTAAFESLGLATEENPMGRFIPVDATGRTAVPGVWAAGNVSDLSAQVGAAAAAGTMVGAQLNAELVMEGL
ncbi:NAD(P)/FAD-dependent oxidoreductase [Citricoccus sp. GCM10030269]|uniref:NAD(P)/FAD-dependent oxidoreductase n=1 Tax=Citricoccus sp. GCM10030269 TaxID=3273388 RepID=UPI0036117896